MTCSLEVCRICLAVDVRMFKILNTNLRETYEKLTEISLNNEDGRSLYACYMCHALLKKCYNFRMKSLRANKALSELLSNDTEITYKSVQFIDRCKYNLLDDFRISPLEDYNTKPGLIEGSDTVVVKQENVPIKTEEAATEDEYNNTDGTLVNRKTRLHTQKKSLNKYENQSVAEEHNDNSVENNTDLRRVPSDTETATVDTAKNENHLLENTFTNTSDINITKEDKNLIIPWNDSNSDVKTNDLFIYHDYGKKYFTKTDLTTHIESHKLQSQDIYYKCDECSYKSVTKDSLNRHLMLHDKNRPFVCEYCSYRYKRKKHLKNHLKAHNGDKSYACNNCEYKSVYKELLVRHLKTHNSNKQYACNICEYKCKYKSNLLRHLKTHNSNKQNTCNICEYKCKYKTDLLRHLKTHSSDKPYACNICEYKCIQRTSLISHLREHSSDNPYACNICEYKCIQKSSLTSHLREHSGNEPACNI